jgi:hypothetical protein
MQHARGENKCILAYRPVARQQASKSKRVMTFSAWSAKKLNGNRGTMFSVLCVEML